MNNFQFTLFTFIFFSTFSLSFFGILQFFTKILLKKNLSTDSIHISFLIASTFLILVFYIFLSVLFLFESKLFFRYFFYPLIFYFGLFYGLKYFRHIITTFKYQFIFSTLVLLILCMYIHTSDPINLASGRLLNGYLASDNSLPWIFSKEILFNNNILFPKYLFADWLSSDRPPMLQAILLPSVSIFFGSNPTFNGRELNSVNFIVSAITLNTFIFIFLNELIKKFHNKNNSIFLTLSILFMPLFLINIVFTWPKILSTIFLIIIFLFLYDIKDVNKFFNKYFYIALAVIFSFLSHGNSIYFIFAFGLLSLRKFFYYFKHFYLLFIFYGPWFIYQKFIVPPGDRLIKYHLADVQKVTNNSSFNEIISSYSNFSFNEILLMKINNVLLLLFGLDLIESQNQGRIFISGFPNLGWMQFIAIFMSIFPFLLFYLLMYFSDKLTSNHSVQSKVFIYLFILSLFFGAIIQFGGYDSKLFMVTFPLFGAILPFLYLINSFKMSLVNSKFLFLISIFWSFFSLNIFVTDKDASFNFYVLVPVIIYLFYIVYKNIIKD